MGKSKVRFVLLGLDRLKLCHLGKYYYMVCWVLLPAKWGFPTKGRGGIYAHMRKQPLAQVQSLRMLDVGG